MKYLKYSNFIFDLDGTLINSADEVLHCIEKAFIKSNCEINKDKLSSKIIGPPLKDIIKLVSVEINDDFKINEIIKNFRDIYDHDKKDISKIYKGVYNVLNYLKQAETKLFIATFKPSLPTMRIIEQFNLNYFDAVYTIDNFQKFSTKEEMLKTIISKFNLEKGKTVMIGDSITDVISAKNVGIAAIGALWGYSCNKELLAENSDITIKSMSELEEYLK